MRCIIFSDVYRSNVKFCPVMICNEMQSNVMYHIQRKEMRSDV